MIIEKFDGLNMFFYLDLLWKCEGVGIGWEFFDGEKFLIVMKFIKGKVLVFY